MSEGTPSGNDRSLAFRIRDGDSEALERLYRQHSESLIGYAASYLRSWDDATDVVQDVFVRIWVNRLRWAPKGSVRAYLFGAVRNQALNVQRDTRRRADLLAHTDVTELVRITGEHLAAAGEDYDAVALARELQQLPERQLSAIRLRYGNELTYEEIGLALEISHVAARKLVTKAEARLKAAIALK